MILALDLSTARTGVARFSDTGEFIEKFSIVPDHKQANFKKIKFIVDELQPHITEANDVIIEGIFLGSFGGFSQVTGFELLARLSGAVVNSWLNIHDTIPLILKATETRKLVGVKGTCQKAEVQIFIAEKFKLATEEQLGTFKAMVEAENGALAMKEFTKDTWKKHMTHVSTYIEGETNLSDDEADAILTGLAYFRYKEKGML